LSLNFYTILLFGRCAQLFVVKIGGNSFQVSRYEKDMKKGFHHLRWKPQFEAGLEGLEHKSLYLRKKSAFDTIIDTIM
jgi:hypothetical protein